MTNPGIVALILRLIISCYSYMLLMASANVLSCELRRPGQCGNQWTSAFQVAGGAASTLWAYITDSPITTNTNARRSSKARTDESQT